MITIERRAEFLQLTDEDRASLQELRPVLEKHADAFVETFYRHLLSFSETRELLVSPTVTKRLMKAQKAYLLSLTDARFDEGYARGRIRVGDTHFDVGLEPSWYLGAYALYQRLLIPTIFAHFEGSPQKAASAVAALMKVLMLDAQLAMDAYIGRRQTQLEYLNAELGKASRELQRSYDRQSNELRVTSARAQAAEELASVATVVAGLAHEIGTPMGVIQGHAELLESSVTDERGRWRLSTIREQIERISRIIQTLLNMARPHVQRDEVLDLCGVIEQSLAFLTEKLRSHEISSVCKPTIRPRVMGDPEKLQQLFLNLFLNAVDAMRAPGSGELTVSVDPGEDDQIEIRIADTGPGIPEDALPHIFEPFYTTKEAGRGNGLGLMVVRGIARDHGGNIAVERTGPQGTCFLLQLPTEGLADTPNM